MTKLQDYYRLFDLFKGHLTDEQRIILEQLEDQLIEEEILPAISESVAPILSNLRRRLTLVVDYAPEEGITVKTTRGEVVVKENTVKKYDIPSTTKVVSTARIDNDEEQIDNESVCRTTTQPITRSETVGFSVIFKDNVVIHGRNAVETFVKTLQKIGFVKISSLDNIKFSGYPLVGKEQRIKGDVKWQEKVEDWYVFIVMSNIVKIRTLLLISEQLNLGLTIKSADGKIYKN